jgi:hypothetical protein
LAQTTRALEAQAAQVVAQQAQREQRSGVGVEARRELMEEQAGARVVVQLERRRPRVEVHSALEVCLELLLWELQWLSMVSAE